MNKTLVTIQRRTSEQRKQSDRPSEVTGKRAPEPAGAAKRSPPLSVFSLLAHSLSTFYCPRQICSFRLFFWPVIARPSSPFCVNGARHSGGNSSSSLFVARVLTDESSDNRGHREKAAQKTPPPTFSLPLSLFIIGNV